MQFSELHFNLKQIIFIHFVIKWMELTSSSLNSAWKFPSAQLNHVLSQLAREGQGLPRETKMASKTFHSTKAYFRLSDRFFHSEVYF